MGTRIAVGSDDGHVALFDCCHCVRRCNRRGTKRCIAQERQWLQQTELHHLSSLIIMRSACRQQRER